MTYLDLIRKVDWSLEYGNITVEEFKQMIEPLHREITAQVEELQEIRQEIEQTTSRYTIARERGGMGQIEWSDRLIKESDILKIIDTHIKEYTNETDN